MGQCEINLKSVDVQSQKYFCYEPTAIYSLNTYQLMEYQNPVP